MRSAHAPLSPREHRPRPLRPPRRGLGRALGAALLAVLLAVPASAGAETLTWTEAKRRALARSPSALLASQALREARADAEGAGRWPRVNPQLSGSFSTGAPFGEPRERAFGVGLSQQLDVFGVSAAASRAARRRVELGKIQAGSLELRALAETAEAFYELERAQRAKDALTALDRRFAAIEAATARAAAAGEKSEVEATIAAAQRAAVASELAGAERALARSRADLAVLVGASAPASLRVEAPAEVPALETRALEVLEALAARRRLEPALARARASVAEAEASLAARARLPSPTLGVGYSRSTSFEEREAFLGDPGGLTGFSATDNMLQVSLVIPIPVFDTNRAARARAAADAATARAQATLALREVQADVLRARSAAEAAHRAHVRWEALAPRLRRAGELVEKAYAVGEVGLLDTLASAERLARAELGRLEARAAYLKARAALSIALGEAP